jgi:hypothetical protein
MAKDHGMTSQHVENGELYFETWPSELQQTIRNLQIKIAGERLAKLGFSLLKSGKVPGTANDGFKIVTAKRLTMPEVFYFLEAYEAEADALEASLLDDPLWVKASEIIG